MCVGKGVICVCMYILPSLLRVPFSQSGSSLCNNSNCGKNTCCITLYSTYRFRNFLLKIISRHQDPNCGIGFGRSVWQQQFPWIADSAQVIRFGSHTDAATGRQNELNS